MGQILVVEDEPDLLYLIKAILEIEGHEISLVSNGIEGLEVMAKVKVDLIIVDIMLPFMSGIEMLKRVKARDDWAEIPCILMSAYVTTPEVIDSCDCDVFLKKPFSADTLRKSVTYLLMSKYAS